MFKFYEFKNMIDSLDIMVYGEIISGGEDSKWDSTDVCFQDFKAALDNLGDRKIINIYINSVGGSVTTTQGIVAMLQRVKDKGVIINSYIDGIGASCSSFLPMVSNNIYAYNSSLLMLHKPMARAAGNAVDLQATIDVLNKVEESVMIPLYLSKAREDLDANKIKEMLAETTWLNAKEMSELFNITILNGNKDLVACVKDKNLLNSYKNVPEFVKSLISNINNDEAEIKRKADEELALARAKMELEIAML